MVKSFYIGCLAAMTLAMAASAVPAVGATVQDDDYVDMPGMGLSEVEPEGTPFVLPEGLTVEAPIRGYNSADPSDCDHKYSETAVGQGEQVRLCLILNNATNQPITLQLPPGLVFVSRSRKTQNGMIAQRIAIEVPAKTRYFQPLFSYCINSGRESAGLEDEFDIGNVTNVPAFQAFFRMVEDKVVTNTNFIPVNQAIKTLSNGEALDADLLARLEAL